MLQSDSKLLNLFKQNRAFENIPLKIPHFNSMDFNFQLDVPCECE
jgi:hypothetical protein